MPLYLFSILAVPKWVLKAIRNLQRNFMWGSLGLNRKWALVSWKEVFHPKAEGGLGLRDLLQRNNTMGVRIWWNWITKPHTDIHHGRGYGKQIMLLEVNGTTS